MRLATVAFYGFGLGLLAVGLRELLTGFDDNRCSMTYMFEYPEYRVSSQANYFLNTSHTTRELACSIPCCVVVYLTKLPNVAKLFQHREPNSG